MPGPALDLTDPLADEDGMASPAGLDLTDPLADDSGLDLVGEAQREVGDIDDAALGALDGLLLNMGDELGDVGGGLANMAQGRPYGDDSVNPVRESLQTERGQQGQLAGNVAGGIGLGVATGGIGGIGSQAAIQGASGGVAGYGANHDPWEALMGAGTGAALGGAGRAASGLLAGPGARAAATRLPPAAPVLDDTLPGLRQSMEYPQTLVPGELQSAADFGVPKVVSPQKAAMASAGDNVIEAPPKAPWSEGEAAAAGNLSPAEMGVIQRLGSAAAGALGGNPITSPMRWGASKLISKVLKPADETGLGSMRPDERSVNAIMSAAQGAHKGAAGMAGAERALIARPDTPTVTWAMQSVNASGDTGLPPKAQARLDEALMSGDDSNVSSVYMQLSMAYPGFQKRMQAEIEALNNEDG